MIENFNIICFSTADWNPRLPTNKYQLMSRLAGVNNLLYIETFGIRRPRLASQDIKRIAKRLRSTSGSWSKSSGNVSVLSPKVIPSHTSFFRAVNRMLFLPSLNKAIRNLRFADPIVWVYNPYAVHYLDAIVDKSLTIYHCVDDLSLVPGANKDALDNAERKLLEQADIVFATSQALAEKCMKLNPQTFYQPNVADFEHFHSVEDTSLSVHPSIESLKKPVIMFSGNLAPHKVDFRLIRHIAESKPEWSLAIIGPRWEGQRNDQMESLFCLDNVHFLGHIPYPELPEYLKGANILIIPYLKNDVTENIFPLKLYEYLSTGKPVVSTDLASLRSADTLISLADDYDSFVNECERLLDNPDVGKSQRIECAKANTWKKRIDEMSQIILESLSRVQDA